VADNTPAISVIVPAYNEAGTLLGCINTLCSRNDIAEIIVVDSSRTGEIANHYEQNRVAYLSQSVPITFVGTLAAGRACQMNFGASIATGDVLLFLHVDTILPDKDFSRVFANKKFRDCWGRFDIQLASPRLWARLVSKMINMRTRLSSVVTGDQALFVGANLWQEIGGYADIPLMEDIEISDRLRARRQPLHIADRVTTSARRWQSAGVLTTIFTMWRLRLLFWLGVPATRLASLYRDVR
jgi:rSAM/selenodomain-associated transferase 2